MPPKDQQLTAQQKADKKLAESFRAPLSFNTANSTPTITTTQHQERPASPSIFTDIGNVTKKFIAGGVPGLFKDTTPTTYGEAFKQFGQNIEAGPFGSKALSTPQGIQEAALSFSPMGMAKATGQIVKKEAQPVFEGLKDLSTSIVEKLKGRTTVSKQFIADLTRGADVKLPEKNIINNVLENSPDNISVQDFAKKIQDELLPLQRIPYDNQGSSKSFGAPKYENISLPLETKGNVINYQENLYASPIKTSAGSVHFGNNTPNYFGHTRIEDMADNQTRRVIEVQSDLYQKGNLERELGMPKKAIYKGKEYTVGNTNPGLTWLNELGTQIKTSELNFKYDELKLKELSKLQQYNDPTAHFRMIREEIKKAAEDGKTKLQFPTGETAMKVEGLGQQDVWDINNEISRYRAGEISPQEALRNAQLTPEKMRIGMEISKSGEGDWIITDVLGDGKFRAFPKAELEHKMKLRKLDGLDSSLSATAKEWDRLSETFDISGKVDQNNPIYKFYEKEVGKYLKKFDAKLITDDKGVTWWEIPVKPEQATQPVQAFGKIGIKPLLAGAGVTGSLFTAINTGSKVSYEREEPIYSNQQIRDAIAINETSTVKNPYSFHKFSGSIKMGEDLGKYQVTTENLRLYGERYLGKKVTPKQFLASPELQDKYIEGFINEMQTKYNATPEQILEMWRGGLNVNPNKPHIKEYRQKGMKNLETMLKSKNQTS